MEKFCISVDWLQVCCYCKEIPQGSFVGKVFRYDVNLTAVQTAMFKQLYEVKRNGMLLATIQAAPRPATLHEKLCLLKIENRVLYSDKYIAVLYDIMNTLKMTYKGITRLDLCYDCNYFKGHRSVPKFIQNFVMKEVGTNGYIYRKGSKEFTCHGSKDSTSSSKINSISFGSSSSKVRQYIYDKTVELQQVKDKPWIREFWEMNGLISNEENHVWRTEISIKSQGMDILNMSTGELFKLSPIYLEHYEQIQKLFFFYANKYMRFFVCNGEKRTRDYKQVDLFEFDKETISCKPIYINIFHDAGRTEKICVNKLMELQERYVDISEQQRHGLYTAQLFLETLSNIKAARNRITREDSAFKGMMGCRFLEMETEAYFETLEKSFQDRREILSNQLYETYLNSCVK